MKTPILCQDLHTSNIKFSPFTFNPAQTGLFNNTLRVGATVRDQFRSFITIPYQSTSFWMDSPVIHGFTEQHWLGIGISGFADRVGELGQRTSGGTLSAAYHMALDKKYNQSISIGVQLGSIQRKFSNPENARFGDVSAGVMSQDFNLLANDASTISEVNLGVVYQQKLNKRTSFILGAALMHANAPSFTISGSSASNSISRRYNIDVKLLLQINKSFTLIPTLVTSFMGQANNIQVQCFSEFIIDSKKNFSLTPGLGYRYGDALQIHLGGIYDQWHVGLSYDVTLSSAAEFNQHRGGIEIGAIKYIDIQKKPTVDPLILCPRL